MLARSAGRKFCAAARGPFAYTWNVFTSSDDQSPYPESYLTVELEPHGTEVLLTLAHQPVLDRFAKQSAMVRHAGGGDPRRAVRAAGGTHETQRRTLRRGALQPRANEDTSSEMSARERPSRDGELGAGWSDRVGRCREFPGDLARQQGMTKEEVTSSSSSPEPSPPRSSSGSKRRSRPVVAFVASDHARIINGAAVRGDGAVRSIF
jgi:hypothetical protein